MIREIITPKQALINLKLPDEMVGKTVEVIAFEIEDNQLSQKKSTKQDRLARILALTAPTLVDLRQFKFDRNQANDYEE